MARQSNFMVALGVLSALGLVASTFWDAPQINNWLFRASTLIMLATSWNLMANAGLVSLGHSAFWGVGSYAAIMSANAWSGSILGTLVVALLAGALMGLIDAAVTGGL